MEYVTLNNGVKMPMAGIGTFLLEPDDAENSVISALNDGYRLIDTANAYMNEKACGRAMKKSGLKREEIFLETKLWPSFYEQEDAVEKTLERLDTDYIDLLLIHQPAGNYVAGYRLMEKAYKESKVRAIGLSNTDVPAAGMWGMMASSADTFSAAYTAAGGVSMVIHLPEEGITGNDHFMFQDLNNDVIANHVENWIQENVK